MIFRQISGGGGSAEGAGGTLTTGLGSADGKSLVPTKGVGTGIGDGAEAGTDDLLATTGSDVLNFFSQPDTDMATIAKTSPVL
ncbi:hypothetical protein E3A20_12190, partial [Planctomyces bekefii]